MEQLNIVVVGTYEYNTLLEAAAKAGYMVGFEQGKVLGSDQIGDAKEAACWLGLKPQTIYKWVKEGKIPHHRENDLLRFSKKEVTEWMFGKKTRK